MKKFTRKSSNMYRQIKYEGQKMFDNKDSEKSEKFVVGGANKSIASYKSLENYTRELERFINWAREEKEVNSRADYKEVLAEYGGDYLEYLHLEKELASTSLHTTRSALNKFADTVIDYENMPKKGENAITQNRGDFKDLESSARFSFDNNEMLVDFAMATGGRRHDLQKLTKESFRYQNDILVVDFDRSKGGRNRTTPILKEYQEKIEKHLSELKENEKIFDKKIHSNAPIHRLRANYSVNLYKDIINDKAFNDKVSKLYELRTLYSYEKNVTSEYYTKRDKSFSGKRDDLFFVSKALGHNRLEVVVNSYLYELHH